MKINAYSITGKALPAWDFSLEQLGKATPLLLTQAIRIYQSNSHQGTSAVKTRGEVNGSTRKIYRQKGTGNARHGAKYAPVFVGGGIAHGPKAIRPENLRLPKAMRRRALATALITRFNENLILGLSGIAQASGKTSSAAKLLNQVANHPKNKVIVITKNPSEKLMQMLRSLQGVTLKRAAVVNAFDLISHDMILLTQPALKSLVIRTQKPTGGNVK